MRCFISLYGKQLVRNVWQEVETGTLIAKMIIDPMILRGVAIATNSHSTNPLVRETLQLMKQTIDSNRDQARWLPIQT